MKSSKPKTNPAAAIRPQSPPRYGGHRRRPVARSSTTEETASSSSSSSSDRIGRAPLPFPPPSLPAAYSTTTTASIQCWAHARSGRRCTRRVVPREGEPIPIPYCDLHLRSGDGALKVVSHPFAGKCLVARYDLPAKYRMVFWGIRGRCGKSDSEDRAISFYPPHKITGRNRDSNGNIVDNYNGVLNPGSTGDLIQYAACPGPNERQNMRSTFQYWGVRNGTMGGLEFVTLEKVPKNAQLCHWYGRGWWSARDAKRKDVGTTKYPAPKRKKSNNAMCGVKVSKSRGRRRNQKGRS